MKKKTFYLESLGCAKNTVDSNTLAEVLINAGYSPESNPQKAENIIVNTCGFIQPARDEAIQTINELSKIKKENQFLFAVGCMAERDSDLIHQKCPEVDGTLGTSQLNGILHLIESSHPGLNGNAEKNNQPEIENFPEFSVQGASAYLKIADGCGRQCSYCRIPLIKGKWVSRKEEDILRDAEILQDSGVKELILIAQDTTAYGFDRGEKDALPDLIEHIIKRAPQILWIRILYAFPGFVSDHLIDLMSGSSILLPYLDIPLQHAHPDVLRRMHRPDDMNWVRTTIEKMRIKIPRIAIRSTFITGFPGETDQEFETLLSFLNEMNFDRVGAFPYYPEEGTPSATMKDDVPEEVKIARKDQLMELQQGISRKLNHQFVGKTLDVLIEGIEENGSVLVGRSYRDAPEIDGLVFAQGKAEIGDIVPVKITSSLEYDLSGIIKRNGK